MSYDAMSRRISIANPTIQAAPPLQQRYTPDRLIGSLTDSNTTRFTPDGFDRLSTIAYPDSSTELLGYGSDGNVSSRKTRAGATISFTYDTLSGLRARRRRREVRTLAEGRPTPTANGRCAISAAIYPE